MYNYISTAKKSTATFSALKCYFLDKNNQVLVLNKGNRIEILEFTKEQELNLKFEIPFFGTIASVIKINYFAIEALLVTFIDRQFCIIEYDSTMNKIVTRLNSTFADNIGKRDYLTAESTFIINSRDNDFLVNYGIRGKLKIVPLELKNNILSLKESFNCALETLDVISICPFKQFDEDLIVVLSRDIEKQARLQVFKLYSREKDLSHLGEYTRDFKPNSSAYLLYPLNNAFLIFSETSIVYFSDSVKVTVNFPLMTVKACCPVDESDLKFLLSDLNGHLYYLVLVLENRKVKELIVQKLGETNLASSLVMLDNSTLYIASQFGDDQLVELVDERDPVHEHVNLLESWPSQAPIIDFCLVDLDKQGDTIVACCNNGKSSSLQVINSGISVDLKASLDTKLLVENVWALNLLTPKVTSHLVLTIHQKSEIFILNQEELEQVDIPGFMYDHESILVENLADEIIQVTRVGIVLCHFDGQFEFVQRENLNLACRIDKFLLVSNGRKIELFTINKKITLQFSIDLNIEASSLFMTVDNSELILFIGTWGNSLLVYKGQNLIKSISLDSVPRSICITKFNKESFLFYSDANGQVSSGKLTPSFDLCEAKQFYFARSASKLYLTRENQILVCGPKPALIHLTNNRLTSTNINTPQISAFAQINSTAYQDSIVFGSENGICIAKLNEAKGPKLQSTKVPLKINAYRVCHAPGLNSFGLLSNNEENGSKTGMVSLLNERSFELIEQFILETNEIAHRINYFKKESKSFIVVGSAIVSDPQADPTTGRLLVFSRLGNSLKLEAQVTVPGCVYAIDQIKDHILVSVHSQLMVYSFDVSTSKLDLVCQKTGFCLAVHFSVLGDLVLVGDLIKSCIAYKFSSNNLTETAVDIYTNTMTSCQIVDPNNFLGADIAGNLFGLSYNNSRTLKLDSNFHLGDQINVLKKGKLSSNQDCLIYATVSGAIGFIKQLEKQEFDLLNQIETRIISKIKGFGNLKHATFRGFKNEKRTFDCENFIDGDLLEMFVDLPIDYQNEIANGVQMTTSQITSLIENMW